MIGLDFDDHKLTDSMINDTYSECCFFIEAPDIRGKKPIKRSCLFVYLGLLVPFATDQNM